jgi:hypothetical protein
MIISKHTQNDRHESYLLKEIIVRHPILETAFRRETLKRSCCHRIQLSYSSLRSPRSSRESPRRTRRARSAPSCVCHLDSVIASLHKRLDVFYPEIGNMHPFGGSTICPRCSKAVYAAEQVRSWPLSLRPGYLTSILSR